jgi:Tfp pilus assembly protein PilX
MSVIAPSSDPRGERGISMFLVVVAMFLTSMFVVAGFAAAGSDFKTSADSKSRKGAYAAAEAGLAYYVKQLRTNPDFWAQCDAANAPNSAEASPINQQYDSGVDNRKWRKLPSISAEYTIELLHTAKFKECDRTKQESLVDTSNGTFKVRVTGREYKGATKGAKRSLIATFKRSGFLKFVYFTDQENRDPQADTNATRRTEQQRDCVNRKRTARRDKDCVEIQFADGDAINGPLHTNDESLLVCGSPRFGREKLQDGTPGMTDSIEVSGVAPGYVSNGGCTMTPKIFTPTGKFSVLTETMDMPESNQELVSVATAGGTVYSGKTIIHLRNNVMDVTNYATGSAVTRTDVSWPGNGVLYVTNNGSCNGEIPTDADYDEGNGCGNVYVSGAYSSSLTIAAANDVIVRPTIGATLTGRSSNANLTQNTGSDAVLGLIANNFVRVGHKVNRGSPCSNFNSTNEPTVRDVRIDAAMMSLLHSFTVDNYDCGLSGTLTVNGAIVQRFRGAVGTVNGGTISTGYVKNYWYDDRLRYRSPPYFLNPLKSKWEVIQTQEQVPAR